MPPAFQILRAAAVGGGHLKGQSGHWLLRGADTGGAFALQASELAPGSGAPLHVHTREEEAFYVVVGSVEARCGDRREVLHAGDTVLLPRGVPHRLKNIGNAPAKVLMLVFPAVLEEFFDAMNAAAAKGQLNPDAMRELARPYGVTILGTEGE